MRDVIRKSDWIGAGQCLLMAWHGLRRSLSTPTEADRFRMEQGQEVGNLARELFPDGTLVSKSEGTTATEVTRKLVADTSVQTLFEAAFQSGPFVARADILRRLNAGWHVLEVKSSLSTTSKISALVADLAYTVMVLRRAGLQVPQASLVLLSPDYRLGDPPDCLFEIIDVTEKANVRVAKIERIADRIAQVLFGNIRPPRKLVPACRSCPLFENECLGAGLAHTVLEIPGLHFTSLKRLSAAGIVDLSAVRQQVYLNERQERARYAALADRRVVDKGLARALESIEWPCHYLDFETVATFLPTYNEHGCHRQVVTQFSIHHRDSLDAAPRHSEYLADATRDCERELAEALIEKLGGKGSIVVYTNFEQARVKALRDRFPDLAQPLQAILARLKDLHPVIKSNVYDPQFKGSFSIKKVLPALVPDLSYAGLDVADGDTAIARFARMARGEVTGKAVESTRRQLLEYCRMDTLAMVRLHETLCTLATRRHQVGVG